MQLSAGNSYVFGTSRSLYSLALAGQAPAFMKRLNRNGVPYVCVLITMGIACLSYLSVSAGVSIHSEVSKTTTDSTLRRPDCASLVLVDQLSHCFTAAQLDLYVNHVDSLQQRHESARS